MLCQMAENEGVEFAGEAGVFHSLLSDNAPSGAGGAAATDSLPTGEQTLAARLKGRNGMGWELGNERGRYKEKIIPRRREPEEWCSRGHI